MKLYTYNVDLKVSVSKTCGFILEEGKCTIVQVSMEETNKKKRQLIVDYTRKRQS